MISSRNVALLAAASLCLLPACGDDDDEGSSGGEPAAPAAFAITSSESGKAITVDAPESVEAGLTEITLENTGKGIHDAQLVRVDGEQTAEQVTKEVLDSGEGAPTPDWAHGAGGVATTPGGETGSATQVLEPGTYYVSVSDTDGGPKAKEAGISKFEVTGEVSGELPETGASIVAKEYGFDATGLTAGKNEITFDNVGKELHHAIALPLNRGATLADAKKAFTSDARPTGPPPVDFENAVGTTVLDGGEKQVTQLELKKGRYVLVCFISDRKGGPPHAEKGMISAAEVK